jgi:hypothetical protein
MDRTQHAQSTDETPREKAGRLLNEAADLTAEANTHFQRSTSVNVREQDRPGLVELGQAKTALAATLAQIAAGLLALDGGAR